MLSRHWRLWLSFPSPPRPPTPEERLAFGLVRCFGVGSACRLGVSPIGLREVTAADRAAATVRRGGTNPSARLRRAPPLSGKAWRDVYPPPYAYAHDGGCLHAACPRRLCQPPWTHSTPTEISPTRRRNQLRRNAHPKRQPLFGRRGLGRRGFSQRSRLPRIPPHVPFPCSYFLSFYFYFVAEFIRTICTQALPNDCFCRTIGARSKRGGYLG